MRDAFAHVGPKRRPAVVAMSKTIVAEETVAAAPAHNSGDGAKSRVTLQPLRDAWHRMIAAAAAFPVPRVTREASAARTGIGGAA